MAQAPVSGPPPSRGVLVVGDIMTDVIVKPDGPLVRGSDRRATIQILPGGSAANLAAWLAHAGVPVALAAKVGAADRHAHAAALRGLGVTPHLAAHPTVQTGTLVSVVDPDGERSFLTDRGANATLDHADLPDTLLNGVAILHLSGYALFAPTPRAAVLDLLRRARDRGVRVSIDPGSAAFLAEVGPAAFLAWTTGASLCVPNADEAAILAGTSDEGEQRRALARHYAQVVIKRGARGAEIGGADGACLLQLPAPRVVALDTTGAGDAFLAAYLAADLAGLPLPDRLARAIAAGAGATTTWGGRPTGTRPVL